MCGALKTCGPWTAQYGKYWQFGLCIPSKSGFKVPEASNPRGWHPTSVLVSSCLGGEVKGRALCAKLPVLLNTLRTNAQYPVAWHVHVQRYQRSRLQHRFLDSHGAACCGRPCHYELKVCMLSWGVSHATLHAANTISKLVLG